MTNDVRERLQEVARTIQVMLPPHTGFALLCFDFGEKQGALEYISNGQREDIVKVMKEFIAKTEHGYGKHLDTGLPPIEGLTL